MNKDSILCPWAGVSGWYELRVSNDGVKVSGRVQMVVYNSLCEVCTLATCRPRVDVCVINGRCYQDGYVNPTDIKQVCYTGKSTKVWSVLTSEILSVLCAHV